MTVSVCMIVKNEETSLRSAIESVLSFADEIVIVDTGSGDRTKEIASEYTHLLFDFPMNFDFSEARNFSFSKCTMDYIYTADADEVIDPENQCKLAALKDALTPEIEIVQMRYRNQQTDGTVYNFETEYRPKLFKRIRSFRWMDPVHEVIDTGVRMINSEIEILHRQRESHAGRDFSYFERYAVPESSLSPRLHRLYAQELFLAGTEEDFARAYTYFEHTLHEETRSPDEIRQSQCVVTRCCHLRRDSTGLFKAALKNMVGKPSAEVCCELGDFFYGEGDFEEAATWYYTAAFGAESELDVHSAGDLPLRCLSKCFDTLGDAGEAERYRRLADEWNPQNPF